MLLSVDSELELTDAILEKDLGINDEFSRKLILSKLIEGKNVNLKF
jgi:hypothetical protein